MAIENTMNTLSSEIFKQSLFRAFSSQELSQILDLCNLKQINKNETIVQEGERIDAIYFIVKGLLEVRKNVMVGDSIQTCRFATLKDGDNIGLGESGLYSPQGRRSATVVAIEDTSLLCLGIDVLHQFLHEHPHADQKLNENIQMVARLNFLAQVGHFRDLAEPILKELATDISKINYRANAFLFQQGDIGQKCYLLESGRAEVLITLANGENKMIGEVEAGDLVGETSLMLDAPRNASVRFTEDASVLSIDKTLFLKLLKNNPNAANALMQLQLARSRPMHIKNVEIHERKNRDETTSFILYSPQQEKYFEFTSIEKFIWGKLDGGHTLDDISIELYQKHQFFNPEYVAQFIWNLAEDELVEVERKLYHRKKIVDLPFLLKVVQRIRRVMEFNVAVGNADHWISVSYQRVVWLAFTKTAQIFWLLLVIGGLITFAIEYHVAINLLKSIPNKWHLFILAILATTCMIPLHELGHAYGAKYYGRRVNCFGIGWFWFGPFAFCDTSDMWLRPNKERIVVDLLGLYVNLIIASLAVLLAYFVNLPSAISVFLWLFALVNYIIVLTNLNPVIELDGYFALMDLLDKPNLKKSSVEWLGNAILHRDKIQVKDRKDYSKEKLYWLITVIFILLIETIFPYFIFAYLLHGMLGVTNPLVTIVVVFIVLVLSSFSIWGDIFKSSRIPNVK